MIEIKTKQYFDLNELPEHFDLFICSSGYESRATHIHNSIQNKIFDSKVCIAFDDNITAIRIQNDLYFSKNKFLPINMNGNFADGISNYLSLFLSKYKDSKNLNILVDYSCMTRVWYGEIINACRRTLFRCELNLFCLYSEGIYNPPIADGTYNKYVEPIFGFSTLSIPERPTALVIGLGYEKSRAYSLKEYLDAEEVYLFIAENDESPQFQEEVNSQNALLINQISQDNIFIYPLKDLEYTESILSNLCDSLLKNYRIIIAPCGPKPFTLLSFIVSSKLKDIDVWRVSAGDSMPPTDIKASGTILAYKIQFKPNDISEGSM